MLPISEYEYYHKYDSCSEAEINHERFSGERIQEPDIDERDCDFYHYVIADPNGSSSSGAGCMRTGGHCFGLCKHFSLSVNTIEIGDTCICSVCGQPFVLDYEERVMSSVACPECRNMWTDEVPF